MFANAQEISGNLGTATGSNRNATKEPGEPNHDGNVGGRSIWYRYTAESTGSLRVDTHGSNFDSILAVYQGAAVNALTRLASDDDTGTLLTSDLTLQVVGGQTYYFAVDGYNARNGTVNLHWALQPMPTLPPPEPGGKVVAIAGDIACNPTDPDFNNTQGSFDRCRMRATSDLLVGGGFDAVLTNGDNQYDEGTLAQFQQSYDQTWGRVKSVTHPALGNHEYSGSSSASGYFDYFGSAGGQPGKGYYSFDLGSWHLIALNSNCSYVACSAGSPQETWLRQDLAAHPDSCVLAYWHHPLFNSGSHPVETAVKPLWNALHQYGADVVVNGHQHSYERFAPQTPNGVADPLHGIRQFTVGTGGEEISSMPATGTANSEVRDGQTFGVLKLVLNPTSYSWQFLPVADQGFTDLGTTPCSI